MKKIVLMAVMAIVSLTASAQSYIGGSACFELKNVRYTGTSHNNSATVTTFGIAPEYGYNLNDKLALGMQIGVSVSAVTHQPSTTTIAVDPYLRYKFVKSGPFTVFNDFVLEWSTNMTDDDSASAYAFGLRPGVSVDLGKNWSVAATTDLFYYKTYPDDDLSQTGFAIDPTNVRLGLFYNF